MKAILVLNDMPTNCSKCKLSYLQGIGESICNAVDWEERPSWCPLKPLPSKKLPGVNFDEEYERRIMYENDGYNKCIDEITGETK